MQDEISNTAENPKKPWETPQVEALPVEETSTRPGHHGESTFTS